MRSWIDFHSLDFPLNIIYGCSTVVIVLLFAMKFTHDLAVGVIGLIISLIPVGCNGLRVKFYLGASYLNLVELLETGAFAVLILYFMSKADGKK